MKDDVVQELPQAIIKTISDHMADGFDLEQAVNILLFNAYLFGGNE
jgi:hypothetical protein